MTTSDTFAGVVEALSIAQQALAAALNEVAYNASGWDRAAGTLAKLNETLTLRTAQRDRARDWAVRLEQVISAAAQEHVPYTPVVGEALELCQACGSSECHVEWPCYTAEILSPVLTLPDGWREP